MSKKRRQGQSRYFAPILAVLLLSADGVKAQEPLAFDAESAADQLAEITSYLDGEDIDSDYLLEFRSRAGKIEVAAADCAAESLDIRTGLEERFEPLRDVDPDDISPEMTARRDEVRSALDAAIAREAVCGSLVDRAQLLVAAITERQNRMAEQFLSSRTKSAITLLREFPQRISTWPSRLRAALDIELTANMTSTRLVRILLAAVVASAAFGLFLRYRFNASYAAVRRDEAEPPMRYLLPKALSEFAVIWMPGVALLLTLLFSVENASGSMAVIRVAWAIVALGLGLVVIDWVTGPQSPSRDIKGLIPDHVAPLRLRLRVILLAICTSYAVLGSEWLSVRISQPDAAGRASMIFLVGVSVLWTLLYLGRIPGLRHRYRALRVLAIIGMSFGLLALLAGYQNLAGYLVQGLTRTSFAIFLLWVFLWLIYTGFNYLIEEEGSAATNIRTTLGISGKRSASGIGFMQLIADLILWISVVVYLIYVWDNTGTTLTQLQDVVTQGWTIGEVRIVPKNIVSGILIFAGLIVVVGWIKHWIDRRWLQRIVIDRGARDAILTLFGYLGFVVALILALILAKVDMTGLAIISGALALGLGFGLQEIANNFVSGLILLFERPIKNGDFVTVGDVEGFVRSIRIRATEIETLDNRNVLVPNSELISSRVTNWVLRDTFGRVKIRVGVAYGSDIELVRNILEGIGHEHPEVITDGRAPAPRALFRGFGDSSLDFELYVRVQRVERRFSVHSDLNFAIDKAFREAGITIPLPQRDLHIVSYPQDAAEDQPKHAGTASRVRPMTNVTRSHDARLQTRYSAAETWAALVEVDQLKRWLIRDGSITAELGGVFDYVLRDGKVARGRIDVFSPPRRMRMVLAPDEDDGRTPSVPITAEFRIRQTEDATTLDVIVAGIPGDEDWEEYYRQSVDRWRDALADLASDVLGR